MGSGQVLGITSIQKYYNLVSKSQIKLISSLGLKKYRDKTRLFIAEGPKLINELQIAGLTLHTLFTTQEQTKIESNVNLVTESELKKISFLKTVNTSLALFEIPDPRPILTKGLILALDSVRDPGNLGTIIRLCDWFGVAQLVCSTETADCYNPKVIQATMGSIARVQITYLNLADFIAKTSIPAFGACMNGTSVYNSSFPEDMMLILGNEANGISEEIMELLERKITIPKFGAKEVESLNVATATAVLLSEMRRSTER